MALEIATDASDGKNDKTQNNYQEYVNNKRTRDWTHFLFCVLPSVVLTHNAFFHTLSLLLEQLAH